MLSLRAHVNNTVHYEMKVADKHSLLAQRIRLLKLIHCTKEHENAMRKPTRAMPSPDIATRASSETLCHLPFEREEARITYR